MDERRDDTRESHRTTSILSTDSGLGEIVGGGSSQTETDVYICHGRADAQAASDLYHALKKDHPGIRVFYGEESIDWGQSTIASIQTHLAVARLAVVLVSNESLRSFDHRLELDSLLDRQRSEEKEFIRPVLIGRVDAKPFKATMPFIATLRSLEIDDDATGSKRFEALCGHLISQLTGLFFVGGGGR